MNPAPVVNFVVYALPSFRYLAKATAVVVTTAVITKKVVDGICGFFGAAAEDVVDRMDQAVKAAQAARDAESARTAA